jgi:glycosyltransferase involved in cell wall biosynthesis
MRVLLITPSLPPAAEGEAEHGRQIAERLAARGHTVTLVTHDRYAEPGVRSLVPVRGMAGWRWRDAPRLAAHLRRSRAQGVVLIYTARLFDEHPMITFLPTLLRWCLPTARLVVLVEIHRAPFIRGWAVRAVRKAMAMLAGSQGLDYGYGSLLRDAHGVAALGPTILQHLLPHAPGLGRRGFVMPPPPLVTRPAGFDTAARAQARQRLGAADGTCLLAFFGFVYPNKGVETLLDALGLLVRAGRPVRLVMAGGGRAASGSGGLELSSYEATLAARAQALGLSSHVVWAEGYADGADSVALDLLAADIAVLPFDDGAELRRSSIAVVAELGLPLVTTAPTHDEPAFVDGHNVLLCPPCDASALGAAVGRLIDDAGLRARLRAGSLDLAQRWFSWDLGMGRIEAWLADNQTDAPASL